MRSPAVFLLGILGLSACDIPVSPERAADRCEARARAAQGPEIAVAVGANSETGGFARSSIGISSDYIRGLDPIALYESCVFNLTGEPPIRAAQLR